MNKKIAIIFGALSFEHEISIVSAITMKNVLDNDLVYIFIDKNHNFYYIPTDKIKSNLFSSGDYKKYTKLYLDQGSFFSKSLFGNKKLDFSYALNLIHGATGEDGTIASLLEFFNIPFIGPRIEASVVSFNKFITKQYASNCNVQTIDYKYYHKSDNVNIENFPVIIKPAKLGSSIGISIVKNIDELDYALDIAFEFDNDIIIEPFINNVREFNLAGCKIDNKFNFSIIEEPAKVEFLDFDKKYLDFSRSDKVKQANISENLAIKLKENFIKIYNNTFNGSLIRCDFFVIDNEVYLNEINPIPGSMANYLFDDFNTIINQLSNSLPQKKTITINYEYVNKIQSAKGKA